MINETKFNEIVEAAKLRTSDPKWLRAIEKASAAILDGSMIITTLHNGALVTTDGGTYTANGNCSCPARTKHCYHRAGARLMAIYEETTTTVVSRPALIASIKAAWTAKYPTDNLADNLMSRFKKNSLEMLADDMLQGVYAAIA